MGFAVRVRSAGQKYGPTCHQRDRADVTEFVTLVRLSSLGQHVGVLALAGYKRRKSALTAGPIGSKSNHWLPSRCPPWWGSTKTMLQCVVAYIKHKGTLLLIKTGTLIDWLGLLRKKLHTITCRAMSLKSRFISIKYVPSVQCHAPGVLKVFHPVFLIHPRPKVVSPRALYYRTSRNSCRQEAGKRSASKCCTCRLNAVRVWLFGVSRPFAGWLCVKAVTVFSILCGCFLFDFTLRLLFAAFQCRDCFQSGALFFAVVGLAIRCVSISHDCFQLKLSMQMFLFTLNLT